MAPFLLQIFIVEVYLITFFYMFVNGKIIQKVKNGKTSKKNNLYYCCNYHTAGFCFLFCLLRKRHYFMNFAIKYMLNNSGVNNKGV